MWSTYLTIVPTVREEASLRFDVLNAWDNHATISIPLFHYNLHSGELGGLLAFMRDRKNAVFQQAVEFFGVKPRHRWPNTDNLQAKRTSPMQLVRKPGHAFEDLPGTQAEENYFKTWHWFYRLVMANRIFDDWKRTAYDFARIRLQEHFDDRTAGRERGHRAA